MAVSGAVAFLAAFAGAMEPAAEKPAVAVLPLEAKNEVTAAVADLLSDALLARVRAGPAFARVVSPKELETSLGFERQRQLLNCDDQGCIAEIAGALNVQFILAGSVGRLGDSFLLNLKLIRSRDGLVTAAVTERARGNSAEALIDVIEPAIQRLLGEGGIIAAVRTEKPVWPWIVVGAAPVVAGLGVLSVVAGAIAAAAGAFMLQGLYGWVVPVTGIPIYAKLGTIGAGFGGGALLVVIALASFVVAGALLAGGVVARVML